MILYSYIVLPLYHVGTENTEVFEDIEEDDFSIWEEESETLQADSQVVWLVFLIGCLQREHYIPDSAISLLLQIIDIFLKVLSKLNPLMSDVVKCFPLHCIKCTIYLDLSQLHLQSMSHAQNVAKFIYSVTASKKLVLVSEVSNAVTIRFVYFGNLKLLLGNNCSLLIVLTVTIH